VSEDIEKLRAFAEALAAPEKLSRLFTAVCNENAELKRLLVAAIEHLNFCVRGYERGYPKFKDSCTREVIKHWEVEARKLAPKDSSHVILEDCAGDTGAGHAD
jgi:hypothetical protein